MNAIIQDFPRCKDHCLKMQDANSKMELVEHKWEFVILDFKEIESKVSETCYFLLMTSCPEMLHLFTWIPFASTVEPHWHGHQWVKKICWYERDGRIIGAGSNFMTWRPCNDKHTVQHIHISRTTVLINKQMECRYMYRVLQLKETN